jgi:hypothetical protein
MLMKLRVLAVTAVLSATACASNQATLPIGTGMQAQSLVRHSWMRPDAKKSDLIYVGYNYQIDVYSYPKGDLVGQLTLDYVSAICSDKNGNVWIGNTLRNGSQMVEYAHGATDPTTQVFSYPPRNCAVDPKSGDMAVVGFGDSTGKQNIEIYAQAQGLPQTYSSNYFTEWWACTYDSKGNLMIQGTVRSFGEAGLGELLKGHKKITPVNLQTDYGSAGVQWDGKYFLVAYENDKQLFRYQIKNGNATFVDNVNLTLPQGEYLQNMWLTGNTVFASGVTFADTSNGPTVGGFAYPAGGAPLHAFEPGLYPLLMTVSVAPKTTQH